MINRRNYYRVLQVQPDAPEEIIRASYRALLRELKNHPDLGGDAIDAAVINEAYETLSERNRRADYDKKLLGMYMNSRLIQRKTAMSKIETPPPRKAHSGQILPVEIAPSAHLTQVNHFQVIKKAHDRRAIHRVNKKGKILCYIPSLQSGLEAHMEDLSPKGISFVSPYKVTPYTTIKITSPLFSAFARITRSDYRVLHGENTYSSGAVFLSIRFRNQKGSFFSKILDESPA